MVRIMVSSFWLIVAGTSLSYANEAINTMLPVDSISTTTVKAKPEGASRFGLSYFSWNWVASNKINRGEFQDAFSLNHVGFDYATTKGYKWSLRPQFEIEWDGKGQRETRMGDTYINFSKSRWVYFPGDIYLNFWGRLYAPTSEASAELGRVESRAYAFFIKQFNKRWSLEYLAHPRYYHYQKLRSYDEDNVGKGQKGFVYYHEFRGKYYLLKPALIPYTAVGVWHQWNHLGRNNPGGNWRGDLGYLESGFEWEANDNLWLSAFALQERDIIKPKTSYTVFRDDETTYHFMFLVSM